MMIIKVKMLVLNVKIRQEQPIIMEDVIDIFLRDGATAVTLKQGGGLVSPVSEGFSKCQCRCYFRR